MSFWTDPAWVRKHWDITSVGEVGSSEHYWEKMTRKSQLHKKFEQLDLPVMTIIKKCFMAPLDATGIVGVTFGGKKLDDALWAAVLPNGVSMKAIRAERRNAS
jgi:hypothetical protein